MPDLIVIGGGPGGYVAAIRAAQLKKSVTVIEKETMLGGTCLRVGCIPSKALLDSSHLYEMAQHSMASRGVVVGSLKLDLATMLQHKESVVRTLGGGIDGLMKKNKITRVLGTATITAPGRVTVDGKDGKQELQAEHILIATGSTPVSLPGIELDGDRIGTSTEALCYPEVPKHLIVIGAGVIGLELGTVWRRLGAKVTVLEYLDRILPGMDNEIAAEAKKIFEKQGITFRLSCKVTGAKVVKKECQVTIDGGEVLTADRVLVAVGRKPNTQGLGLENVGVQVDKRGFITVDQHMLTSTAGILAVGDVVGGAMLAHKAEEEGVAAVEHLYTGYGHVNYDAIPGVVYTEPEIASVGHTEEALNLQGRKYRKGSFPFLANGRARASGTTDGKVKILADAATDRVLGVHIIGPHAGELIAACTAAIEFGASSEDIARTCHAHPTLAEAVKEAALAVDGRVLHM
jgi:dihydrolipoamide dehydrogenase